MERTRREVLLGAAGLATAMALEGTAIANVAASSRLRVIVAGGHPGDPEYGCGGTVARLTSLGAHVTLLYLNDGAWPPTPAPTRVAEAAKACALLKATPAYAGQANGHAVVDNAHYTDFGKIIAAENPDVVITQWPLDNHRDHRAIAMLSYDAWVQAKKQFALYYYEVSDGEDTMQFAPTHFVDITETEAIKRQACYAHASQTPDRYYALQDEVALMRGLEAGCKRAEAFIWQVQSPSDPLRSLAKTSRTADGA